MRVSLLSTNAQHRPQPHVNAYANAAQQTSWSCVARRSIASTIVGRSLAIPRCNGRNLCSLLEPDTVVVYPHNRDTLSTRRCRRICIVARTFFAQHTRRNGKSYIVENVCSQCERTDTPASQTHTCDRRQARVLRTFIPPGVRRARMGKTSIVDNCWCITNIFVQHRRRLRSGAPICAIMKSMRTSHRVVFWFKYYILIRNMLATLSDSSSSAVRFVGWLSGTEVLRSSVGLACDKSRKEA